ncbi:MAG: response regulator transcription factor [Roseburia sp.]|nr:response regulator transcription factor [Ruminococcus sp.]MCM1156760.1 response regulator transcription factor [Roseburia sp.]MCM1241449.1 response regulator transcription factor [Roseburia sp.]
MRILLAEDDEGLNKALTWQLNSRGYRVDSCYNGEDALYYGQQNIYDVILLDRMLPDREGTEVLSTLRKTAISTPVILITALGMVKDKITGLDLGADDYLVKPFDFEELLARIRCVTRRSPVINTQTDDKMSYLDITWSPREMCLCGPDGDCMLSRREGDLLESFIRMPEQTLARETLLLKVWGPDSDVEAGNLDNYIHFLRRRLKAIGSRLQIKTVWGVGYGLVSQ